MKEYLNKIKDKQDRLLLSTTLDKYNKYKKSNINTSTNFLNEYEYKFLCNSLKHLNIDFNTYSVNDYCSKVIIYFGKYDNFITTYKIDNSFTHREILGTLFSIGYTYDMIGDIITDNNVTYITNLTKYNHILINDLISINKTNIKLIEIDNFNINKDKFIELDIIIPSYRLDVIVSKLCNLSRNKVTELIKDKKVLLNYKECIDTSKLLKYEDILSIRGYGKFIIKEEILTTKKNNFMIKICKYN